MTLIQTQYAHKNNFVNLPLQGKVISTSFKQYHSINIHQKQKVLIYVNLFRKITQHKYTKLFFNKQTHTRVDKSCVTKFSMVAPNINLV
jgi:hypothetical protein